MEFINVEKEKLIKEAEIHKKIVKSKFTNEEVLSRCKGMTDFTPEIRTTLRSNFKKCIKELGCNDALVTGQRGTCYFDIHEHYGEKAKQNAIDKMTPWQAVGDYTSGSRPHNFAFKENETAKEYFNGARYTRAQAQNIAKKIDKAFEVPHAKINESLALRHGNDERGLIGLLGNDKDYETFSHSKFVDRLKTLNSVTENEGVVVLNETGFLSTSPSSTGGFIRKPVEVRILCPENIKGVYIDDFSYYQGEEEVILPRGKNFRFVKAYSRDINLEEFENVQEELDGSGNTYATDTIIFLEYLG